LGSSPVFGVIRVAHFLVFCVVCLPLVPCVSNVASFSGLSIIDFLFGFLERLCSTTLNCCTDDIGISVHLAKRFQRKIFLEIDQSETSIACGDHVC
jgi:hypothetical protein